LDPNGAKKVKTRATAACATKHRGEMHRPAARGGLGKRSRIISVKTFTWNGHSGVDREGNEGGKCTRKR